MSLLKDCVSLKTEIAYLESRILTVAKTTTRLMQPQLPTMTTTTISIGTSRLRIFDT